MLTPNDLLQLKTKNLTESQIEEQLSFFYEGFPFMQIKASASTKKGIMCLTQNEQDDYIKA